MASFAGIAASVGLVFVESRLAHGFWEDVVELPDPDNLPAWVELLSSGPSANCVRIRMLVN